MEDEAMIAPVQRTLFDLVQETHQLLHEKSTLEGQFIDVVVKIGYKLIDMRPYKSYGEFIPWLEDEFTISSDTAYNYMHVAETYGNNSERVRNFPLRVVYELASPKMPEEVRTQVESGTISPTLAAIREAKQEAKEYVQYVPPDATSLLLQGTQLAQEAYNAALDNRPLVLSPDYDRIEEQRVHNENTALRGVPPALQSSESNEWYTPSQYVDAARELMGGIDCDPASNEYANSKVVRAATYYDITTNGLDKEWTGRVWINPPYGRDNGESNQEAWSRKLVEQYETGITTEAVLLVNAVTDRKWFQPLWQFPICFTDHRIRFYNTEVEAGQPTHGNALIYLGSQVERFIELFKQFGPVVRRVG